MGREPALGFPGGHLITKDKINRNLTTHNDDQNRNSNMPTT